MPRQSRIDFPGALQHIMLRGMERKHLFRDDIDRTNFIQRLETVVTDTATACHAFALMSNHVHLLMTTGTKPISRVMQSLTTGYAVSFNKRHRRSGRLYQNRFKSVLCDKETYLLELIRYIHINPVRAGMLPDIKGLDRYPWTSHRIYIGRRKSAWVNSDETLSHFGRTLKQARAEYRAFIRSGLEEETPESFDGGGLIRSLGGLWEAQKLQSGRKRRKEAADERILGSGTFVEEVLRANGEVESRNSRLQREGWDFSKVLQRAARAMDLEEADLLRQGRSNARSQGRALLCKWLVVDLQESQTSVARRLEITRPAVSVLVIRGRDVEREMSVGLSDDP